MTSPRLSIIAAVAANGVIGRGNALPWHIPGELKHFRAVTMGHPIIMGRRTWESLGRPLPGRTNIVVSGQADFTAAGARVVRSLEEALHLASQCEGGDEAFVIGGARLFAEALPLARRLHLTEIRADYEGDVCFPRFDRTVFREVSRQAQRPEQGPDHDFVIYERRG